MIVFHLPAPRQLQLFVGKHVQKAHQISVMLIALEVVGIPSDFGDHVLQTRVVCKHAVGTLAGRERTDKDHDYYHLNHFAFERSKKL